MYNIKVTYKVTVTFHFVLDPSGHDGCKGHIDLVDLVVLVNNLKGHGDLVSFLQYFAWLRITDGGSIPKMCV